MKSIRDTLYHHTQYLPFSWHVQHQTGEIIQRCTSDVEVIRNFRVPAASRGVPNLFSDHFVSGNHVFHECAHHPGGGSFFPVIIGYSAFFIPGSGSGSRMPTRRKAPFPAPCRRT
ncbi:MAG: hypothetical protein ACLU6Y_14155 [Ruminococcus sp.]